MEKWKKIREAPRLEISDRGRVRWKMVKIGALALFDVIRKPQVAPNGSLYIPHRKPDGKQLSLYINRLVARYFLPKPRGGRASLKVGWKDGNRENNTAKNLFWY